MTEHTTRHHRVPRSKRGNNSVRNISHVSAAQHQAYHTLFANKDPWEIAEILTKLWIDPDIVIYAMRRPKPWY